MAEIASILRPVRDSNRGRIYRVGFAATNLATNFSLTQKLYWKMHARKSSPDSLSRPPASLDRPRCHGSRAHGARRRCGAGNGRWHGRVHDWTAGIHTGCSHRWQEPGGEPPGSRPDGPASRPAHGCCQTPDRRGGKSDKLCVSARRERPPPVNEWRAQAAIPAAIPPDFCLTCAIDAQRPLLGRRATLPSGLHPGRLWDHKIPARRHPCPCPTPMPAPTSARTRLRASRRALAI